MEIVNVFGSRAARRGLRAAGTAAAVAALALCAYAGGQARRPGAPQQAPAAPKDSVSLRQIKSSAKSGKPAKKGPSANVGQEIRLTGTGFDDNVSVEFTAFANSTFTIRPLEVDSRRVEVKVPDEVISGSIKLVDPESGMSNALTLQIVPAIEKLSDEAVAPGGRLLIDGKGFTRDSRVVFPGVETPVAPTIVSATRIDIVVPQGARSGRIAVVTPGGRSKPVKLKVEADAATARGER